MTILKEEIHKDIKMYNFTNSNLSTKNFENEKSFQMDSNFEYNESAKMKNYFNNNISNDKKNLQV